MTSPKDWSKVGPATSNTLFSESISDGLSTESASMIANNLTSQICHVDGIDVRSYLALLTFHLVYLSKISDTAEKTHYCRARDDKTSSDLFLRSPTFKHCQNSGSFFTI